MNKQALAFLTMFSFILMLSVYYVTLPNEDTSVMKSEKTAQKQKTKKTDDTKNTSSNQKAKALQDSINQKIEVELNKNNDIVADSKKSEEEKQVALSTIETLNAYKADIVKMQEALAKQKIQSAIEPKGNTCMINIFEQKDDLVLAKKVMKEMQLLSNQKYFIEVTFK